ncbi:unnamed protein product, partial [Ectocarpus fasciculatus]
MARTPPPDPRLEYTDPEPLAGEGGVSGGRDGVPCCCGGPAHGPLDDLPPEPREGGVWSRVRCATTGGSLNVRLSGLNRPSSSGGPLALAPAPALFPPPPPPQRHPCSG